jgi:hypothetical protein
VNKNHLPAQNPENTSLSFAHRTEIRESTYNTP